jgi:hypothetical protein
MSVYFHCSERQMWSITFIVLNLLTWRRENVRVL